MGTEHIDDAGARRRARLAQARLYVCADLSRGPEGLLALAEAAFRGGVDIFQVRDKQAEARAEVEALRALRPLADRHGAMLAANDRADVAVLAGADVLHLGQGDLSTSDARSIVGPDVLIGRSTRTVPQLREADEDPEIDYFCTGPVWATPTKPGRAPVGLDLPRVAAERAASSSGPGPESRPSSDTGPGSWSRSGPGAVPKPFFAIGGIDLDRVPAVRAGGADRIVVVRAVTQAPDPEQAARALRSALTSTL